MDTFDTMMQQTYGEDLGPSNAERNTTYLTSEMIHQCVKYRNYQVYVSGIPISIQDLAQSGWTCKIFRNPHGGRIKVSFHGYDHKSIITFKLAPSYQTAEIHEILAAITREPSGILTVSPKVIPAEATDAELLAALNRNADRRRKARALTKPKKRANPAFIQQVMAAVG